MLVRGLSSAKGVSKHTSWQGLYNIREWASVPVARWNGSWPRYGEAFVSSMEDGTGRVLLRVFRPVVVLRWHVSRTHSLLTLLEGQGI